MKELINTDPIDYMGRQFCVRVTQSHRYPYYYVIDGEFSGMNYLKEEQAISAAKSRIEKDRHKGITH